MILLFYVLPSFDVVLKSWNFNVLYAKVFCTNEAWCLAILTFRQPILKSRVSSHLIQAITFSIHDESASDMNQFKAS